MKCPKCQHELSIVHAGFVCRCNRPGFEPIPFEVYGDCPLPLKQVGRVGRPRRGPKTVRILKYHGGAA